MSNIVHIIGHPGTNGGTVSLAQIVTGLKNYENVESDVIVVNSGGKSSTTNLELFESNGATIKDYQDTAYFISQGHQPYDIIVQHRLAGAMSLPSLGKPYIVVNHTSQLPQEMKRFTNADAIVYVSNYLWKQARVLPPAKSHVIINGIENPTGITGNTELDNGLFNTGRCHRLSADKMPHGSIPVLIPIKGHKHWVIGNAKRKTMGTIEYLPTISNQSEKLAYIMALDLYLYDAQIAEGTSMAVLESLSCGVPVLCRGKPGTDELVFHKRNGFIYNIISDAVKRINQMKSDNSALLAMKQQTLADFDQRLHIRHCVKKYADLFSTFG